MKHLSRFRGGLSRNGQPTTTLVERDYYSGVMTRPPFSAPSGRGECSWGSLMVGISGGKKWFDREEGLNLSTAVAQVARFD